MQSDKKILLLFLVIALVILIFYQNSNNSSNSNNSANRTIGNRRLTRENFTNNEFNSISQDNMVPVVDRTKVDERVLDNLIDDINYNNNLVVNGENGLDNATASEVSEYERQSNSINKAPSYRNVSYKSSGYRNANFGKNENMPDNINELDKFLEDTNVFNDVNENNSSNYSGYDDNNSNLSDNSSVGKENSVYAPANIAPFQLNNSTQKDKIMNLYNSNNYLPNESKTNPNLSKGFQILDNPVAVSNPNLIPVLKSIPVSSTLGSKRNSTYDIRSEPPNPKTTISPFLNSDIMPDVYATNRGCL
jgi:hypothetical protein